MPRPTSPLLDSLPLGYLVTLKSSCLCQDPVVSIYTRLDGTTLRAGRCRGGKEKKGDSEMLIQNDLPRTWWRASDPSPWVKVDLPTSTSFI